MAINSVNVSRVSFNMRTLSMLEQMRSANLRLFREQQRIATGRQFLSASDDPVAAGKIVRSNELLARQDQILVNLQHSERWLSAAESNVTDVNELLTEAKTIASENINSFQSTEQRQSAALVIDSIIDQLFTLGNQQFDGRYLFGGQKTGDAPLDTALGRVRFIGDSHSRNAFFDIGIDRPFNLTADKLFGLRAGQVKGFADLNPAVTAETRLSDVDGALGQGIRNGIFRVTEIGGGGATFDVDVAGVDTMGELVDRINAKAAAAGSVLTAAITPNGLQINGAAGVQIQVQEVGGAHAAADLGLLGTSAIGAPITGGDVKPRLTETTPLAALNGGAGLTLASGLRIVNNGAVNTISFAGATTVQDVLNRVNGANLGVRLEINAAGNGFDALNELSGGDLSIGENGGTDATALGIRTLQGGTLLSELNEGRGVTTAPGDDLQITDANGVSFGVDLDGAATMQDVINRINTAATGAGSTLVASLQSVGNGLQLSHPAAGTQNITVTRANLSAAADDLGLFKTGGPQTLSADDVRPVRAGGVFSALYRLADGLRSDHSQTITRAGEELDNAVREITGQLGQLGTRSADVVERRGRTEDAVLATRKLVGELQEVDLTEAITKFQQAQLALQANLQTGSSLLNLSLFDFLR